MNVRETDLLELKSLRKNNKMLDDTYMIYLSILQGQTIDCLDN